MRVHSRCTDAKQFSYLKIGSSSQHSFEEVEQKLGVILILQLNAGYPIIHLDFLTLNLISRLTQWLLYCLSHLNKCKEIFIV